MYMSMIFFSDGGGDSARGGDCVYVHEKATEKLAAARLGIDPEQQPEGSNAVCACFGTVQTVRCVIEAFWNTFIDRSV